MASDGGVPAGPLRWARAQADQPIDHRTRGGGQRPERGGLHEPHRINGLADAVFAIAMTLYVLDVRIPESIADTASGFGDEFPDFLGKFGIFAAAFFLTSRLWIAHHQLMAHVRRVDTDTLVMTVQFLFGIAATPIAMSTLIRYGNVPLAVAFAAGLLALTTLLELRLWLHISSPKRDLADVDPDERRETTARILYSLVLYLLVIPLAYALPSPAYSMLLWAVLPLSMVVIRLVGRVLGRPIGRVDR